MLTDLNDRNSTAEGSGSGAGDPDILDININNQRGDKQESVYQRSMASSSLFSVQGSTIEAISPQICEQDDSFFSQQLKDQFGIIQETFDRPVYEHVVKKQGNETFYRNLESQKLNFADLLKEGVFKFKDHFRIRRIKEIVEVEHGAKYGQTCEIGRIQVINYNN